jgi:hypothetical protein
MALVGRRSDEVRNTIRLCNLASARMLECGSALRSCAGRLGRFRIRLEKLGLDSETQASNMKSLALSCEEVSDRLCEAAGELAGSDAPEDVLRSLVPLTRVTTRLLSIAEDRAKRMTSLLEGADRTACQTGQN